MISKKTAIGILKEIIDMVVESDGVEYFTIKKSPYKITHKGINGHFIKSEKGYNIYLDIEVEAKEEERNEVS